MEDFHFTLVGSDTTEAVDLIEKELQKFVKSLQKKGVKIESASINSGHFLGGSRNLVQAEKAPEADSNK